MKHRARTIIIMIIAALLMLSAAAEIILVYRITTNQDKRSGADRLEIVSGELAQTIFDAKLSTMEFAIELQPFLEEKEQCEAFIRQKKQMMIESTDSACFNVYAAASDWYYIPDFDSPADYKVEKRSWYTGAMRSQGAPYVTDPYVDAMTGNICFTISVMLSDRKTIAAMDYTMDNIQKHIAQLYQDGRQKAVIVTEEGIIAGCSDTGLIGKNLIETLPDCAGIFSLVKTGESSVAIHQQDENLFAAQSDFGWFLIVSEDNWSLFRTSYTGLLAMMIISLVICEIVLTLYGLTARSAWKTELLLSEKQKAIAAVTEQLAGAEAILGSSEHSDEAKKALSAVSEALGGIALQTPEKLRPERIRKVQKGSFSRRYRSIVFSALLLVLSICLYINVTASFQYGNGQMQRSVSVYESQLTDWISKQKGILDMFCTIISTNSEILEDYDATVALLDRITQQYPEISVSYMANPSFEPNVIMSNGWKPEGDWHVEDRPWYKALMSSDQEWVISSPYIDDQTGVYCVTFTEKVYDDRTGEYLGNFGIDFYMDKLVDILGSSYSENGYAFLADARGDIINHPYGKYQMRENNSVNVVELPYKDVPTDGSRQRILRDYSGSLKTVIARRNELSGFTVYVAGDIWTIYRRVMLSGSACILVLIICIILVYKVMTSVVNLQDEANRKLRESAEAAIAADEAKSSFLAQMSHEIRTPINAVLGMNEMILMESGDAGIREYAGNIRSAGKTLLTLINSILDFSKIENGKMEIVPVQYDTAEMLRDLVNSIAQRAKEKGLTFITEADETLPAGLRGDDVRIRQIIINLLTNAVKYTEKGTVKLSVQKEPAGEGKILLCVSVSDTGIGIREEDLNDLFVSFKRLDLKHNRNIEGTGLGMSIVTKLLEMMNSKLDVQSVYGEGSVFSFRLEQEIVNAEPMGNFEAHTAEDAGQVQAGRILYAPDAKVLVVDDNNMNLKVAEGLLKLYGIRADTALSGERALEILRQNRYDIILLDHMMPKMDGIEVLHEIQNKHLVPENTVIIALTANAIVGAREKYLEAGFADYLSKPIEPHTLETQLCRSLPDEKKQYRTPEALKSQPEPKQEPEPPADSLTYDDLLQIRTICPGLNVVSGLRYCMDSKEFWLDTLDGFRQADKTGALQTAFDNHDAKNYRITVHSLKSAAKTIGADGLSELAKALEYAARDGIWDEIAARHDDLLAAYHELNQGIEKILSL